MKRAGLAKLAKKEMYLYFTSEFKNLPLLNMLRMRSDQNLVVVLYVLQKIWSLSLVS